MLANRFLLALISTNFLTRIFHISLHFQYSNKKIKQNFNLHFKFEIKKKKKKETVIHTMNFVK